MRKLPLLLLCLALILAIVPVAAAQSTMDVTCDGFDEATVTDFETLVNSIFHDVLTTSLSLVQNANPAPDELTDDLAQVYAISSRYRQELLNGYTDLIASCDSAANAAGALGTVITIAYTGTLDRYVSDGQIAATVIPAEVLSTVKLETLSVGTGFGAQKGDWTVYFNAPTGSSDRSTYVDGIDVPLANAINSVEETLDISAFEFNNVLLTDAVLAARERGVIVRIVTDDEFGLEEEDESIPVFIEAGIPVVDDERSGLMHNKFMILDEKEVWTGSWNYTVNGTYRNNNNALVMRSPDAAAAYQSEFNEMFENHEFGITSTPGIGDFTINGDTPVKALFASEDDVIGAIVSEIDAADSDVRFMAFSFTHNTIGKSMLAAAERGVNVQGIFELRGSETRYSELTALYCAGLDARQDGNKYVLHHKVIIVDDDTVMTGSFNFSGSATEKNDENIVIIKDKDLAALYIEEYNRRYAESAPPPEGDIVCE